MAFIVVVMILLLGVTILIKSKRRRYKDFLSTIPGPKPYSFIGNVLDFRFSYDVLSVLLKYTKTYGDIFVYWIGSAPKIMGIDYKYSEVLLSSTQNITKSHEYTHMHKWLGQGLLTSEPKKWIKHRKILTPAFHFNILEKYVGSFEGPTMVLIKKLKQRVGVNCVDIYPLVNLCSLDLICEVSMGTSVNAQEDENSEYVRAVGEIRKIIIDRSFSVFKQFDFCYRFSRDYYKEEKALKILHEYTDSVIKRRKEELLKEQKKSNMLEHGYSKNNLTFLDVLLLSQIDGESLTDIEIREEVDTFMFEGHDTVTSAISFILYLLATNPKEQKEAFDEQIELFGNNKDHKPCLKELQNMKYLEFVIKEGLRLYPSVPYIGRLATEDMDIDGKIYPKGLYYYAFPYGIHRNPKYFKDPDTFNPMRFADMDSKLPFAYIPFSAGSRNCIGQKFALFEMKYVISSILRHFKLKPSIPKIDIVVVADIILKSETGMNISIVERNHVI